MCRLNWRHAAGAVCDRPCSLDICRDVETGKFPSQGTAPVSPLFWRALYLAVNCAGQQGSWGYSLAKEAKEGVDAP